MMKKKLASLIISMSVTAAMFGSLPANALFEEGLGSDEERFAGCIRLEEPNWFGKSYDEVYMNYHNDFGGATVYFVRCYPDTIWMDVPVETNLEELAGTISSIDGELELSKGVVSNESRAVSITRKGQDKEAQRLNTGTVKALYSELKDIALHFDYYYDRTQFTYASYSYMTGYDLIHYDSDVSLEEKLSEYIENSGIRAELVKYGGDGTDNDPNQIYRNIICVVPTDELSPIQHYEFAKDIADSTGLRPKGLMPEIVGVGEKKIDVVNSVNGDANCDGQLTLADAATVLQGLGNPDKYRLSAQGEFNADLTGDGLTIRDAIEIQRHITGEKDESSQKKLISALAVSALRKHTIKCT